MSEHDPYASSRQTLRETVKWITTLVMGFLAALVAGVTFSSLGTLSGDKLIYALIASAFAVLFTLFCIRVLLDLLLSDGFRADQMKNDDVLKAAIAASGVLPAQYKSFDDLDNDYQASVTHYILLLSIKPHKESEVSTAHANMVDLQTARFHAVSYAAFLDLTNRIRKSLFELGVYGLVIFAALGCLSVLLGASDDVNQQKVAVQLSPGAGWEDYANALSDTCGEGPFRATAVPESPFNGWWLATFERPGTCAGMALPIPSLLIAIPLAQ